MLDNRKKPQATFVLLIGFWVINAGMLQGAAEKTAWKQGSLQSSSIVFAVIGDYGSGEQPEADVANLVKSWDPDFIVTVGDNNYPNGTADTIDRNIGQYYHEYIFPYTGSYGPGSPYKRFFPALGNHDWGSNGPRPYFNYFGFYNEKGYYEFVQGPVHFFILDSDPKEPDGITSTSKQAKWLKNALAASTSEFKIVVTHHPPYSSGKHGSTSVMQWPYEEWGADAVLSGHDHLYERILVDGFPYFVNGIGGDDIYSFGSVVPGSEVRFNQDFGAMRVEASNTYMKFQGITRAGIVVDEFTISNAIPRVTSISRTHPALSGQPSLDYQITFSESVTGVDVSDFALSSMNISGASITSVSGAGSIYTASVNTGTGDGTLRLDLLDDDSIVNTYGRQLGDTGIGNGNFLNTEVYTVDKTTPTLVGLARVGPPYSNASRVEFTATFSEPVNGVDITDFTLTSSTFSGDSVASISGAGSLYVVSVDTGTGDHTLGINFHDDDSIMDAAGNTPGGPGVGNGNLGGAETYFIDKAVPLVTSIIRASPNPISAASADFIVTFSESVNGVDVSDFALNTTNLSNATIIAVDNADPFYIVKVNTGNGAGELRLDLIDNDSIQDAGGNTMGGIGAGNGDFINGESYNVDKGPPTVISISRASPDPTNASQLDFTVIFSESVTGVDVSDFIASAENINDASISSVSGAANIYTISVHAGSGDGTLRIDLLDDDSIANNYGSKLGDTGVDNGNFVTGEAYLVDKTTPAVTSIIRGSPNPSMAANVDFIVTFSEPVAGVDASDFLVNMSGIYEASVTSVASFDPFYIVTVNTGIGAGTLQLDFIDNDTVSDAAANTIGGANTANFTNGEIYDISKASVNFPPPAVRGFWRHILTDDSTPPLGWMPVLGAQAYEVVIASDDGFSHVVTSQVTRSLSLDVTSPLADGKYYWHVRAYNVNLEAGRFSQTRSFTVDTTPPPAPSLISPAENARVSTRPFFQWERLDAATKYHIQVDNNLDFSSPEYTSSKQEASIRMPRLARGTYFWRVRANDQAGNLGSWSIPFTFIIP
jgi:hypothetical protein